MKLKKTSRVRLVAFVWLLCLAVFRFSGFVAHSSGNSLLIYALYYDTYLLGEPEEAFAIFNTGNASVDLGGWRVENRQRAVVFPSDFLAPGDYVWAAKTATAFSEEFGFSPGFEYGDDTDPNIPNMSGLPPSFSNTGGELLLKNPSDFVVDALVYEGGNNNIQGWSGPALKPYKQGDFGIEGQILYRKLDQATGLPVADTNTATDWAQNPDDDVNGKKVRYPGWDLEHFFFTNIFTETANITYLIAPDNIYDGYLNIINQAMSSIQIEGYSFTNASLADALVTKLQEKVSVRILLEEEILGGTSDQQKWICQQIEKNGGECWFMFNDSLNEVHDRYDFQHAKFTIVDGKIILTGSENLNSSSMPEDDKSNGTWGNRGVYLVTDSPMLVSHALDVFTRDLDPAHHKDVRRWNAAIDAPPVGFVPEYETGGTGYDVAFPDPLDIVGTFNFEVVSSPENALRATDSLLGMVSRAGPGGFVYVEQLYERTYWGPSDSNPQSDPNPRLNAYIDAARRSATVRILLDSFFDNLSNNPRSNWETCNYINRQAVLEGLDMQCKVGNPTGTGIHNKMVLVWDGHQGWSHTGSINGSENSSKNNRELAVQVASNEAFTYLSNVFLHDWGNDIEPAVYLPLVLR